MRLCLLLLLVPSTVLGQLSLGPATVGQAAGAIFTGSGTFAGAPMLLQAATNNGSGSTFALTNSMTVSGFNPIVVWLFSSSSLSAGPTNVALNTGTAGILWTNGGNSQETNWIYYLLSPPAGTYNVWAMVNVSASMQLTTLIFTNCSGVETPNTNYFGSTSACSNIVNSAANDSIICYNIYADQIGLGGIAPTPFTGQVGVATNVIGGGYTDLITTNLGTATSNTNGITWNASRQQNIIGGGLKGF